MRTKIWLAFAAVTLWACGGAVFSGGGSGDGGTDGGGGSGSGSSGGSSSGSGGSGSGSGGSSSGSGSGGTSSGGSGSGSGSGGSSSGNGSGGVSPCPSNAPTGGGTCSPVGLQCEYGDNANPNCDDLVTCTSTGWSFPTPGPACPTGTCPATYADVPQNKACTPDGLDCSYSAGQCNCTSTTPVVSNGPIWVCTAAQAGCPSPRPDLGTACSQPGLSCDYGACSGGIAEVCQDGYWQEQATACPAAQ